MVGGSGVGAEGRRCPDHEIGAAFEGDFGALAAGGNNHGLSGR